jgi:hypothetical protein
MFDMESNAAEAIFNLKLSASLFATQSIDAARECDIESLKQIQVAFESDYKKSLLCAGVSQVDVNGILNEIYLDYQYEALSQHEGNELSDEQALFLWHNLPTRNLAKLHRKAMHDYQLIHPAIQDNPEFASWCFICGIDLLDINTSVIPKQIWENSVVWLARFKGGIPSTQHPTTDREAALSRLYFYLIERRDYQAKRTVPTTLLSLTACQAAEFAGLLQQAIDEDSLFARIASASNIDEIKRLMFKVGSRPYTSDALDRPASGVITTYLAYYELATITIKLESFMQDLINKHLQCDVSDAALLAETVACFDLLRYPLVNIMSFGSKVSAITYRVCLDLASSSRPAAITAHDIGRYGTADMIETMLHGANFCEMEHLSFDVVCGMIERFSDTFPSIYGFGPIQMNEVVNLIYHLSLLTRRFDVQQHNDIAAKINANCGQFADTILHAICEPKKFSSHQRADSLLSWFAPVQRTTATA